MAGHVSVPFQAAGVKLVVLIIDSDEDPVYAEARKIWRRNAQVHQVTLFFLRARADIQDESVYVDGDTLYTKWVDDFAHRLNDKTLKAFQYIEMLGGCDFVLRTNLSSFYRFDMLFAQLHALPRTQVYAGCPNDLELPLVGGGSFPLRYISGSGFILSADMVRLVLDRKNLMALDIVDDVWLGLVLRDIPRLPLPRCDIEDFSDLSVDQLFKVQARIEAAAQNQVAHFRVKNRGALPRKLLDVAVFGLLVQRFLPPMAA